MTTEVEADTLREAQEIAQDRGLIQLCNHCAGGNAEEEWVTSGELDGTPNITIMEQVF